MNEDQTRVLAGEPPAPGGGAQSPGGRIGAYRLLRLLGKGGMGEVWLAERADQAYSKQVAIKFISGLHGQEAGDWFRRERQALAKLEHPHIARLLDGGETPDGHPFLVMEYVDGVPIDQWSEGKPLEVVLELFVQVCSAIEHAHRALIVHRDIKPANVLVTAQGESRLLDFGIAKEVAESPDERAGQTTTQAYTLHYASPEQMDGGDITVASDIYSLGALLYRLLSGRVPHANTSSALGQLQAIQTTQPQKPSRAVLDDARLAQGERRRRARRLHGDLDDIVLKCLRLEPGLRYGSARELIDDIGRYRSHRPVQARKGSAGYRASRFLRRHWLALAAAAAVLVSLAGGLYSTYLQKQEAERQRMLAQRRFDLSRALVNDVLFEFLDKLADAPGTMQARRHLVDRTKTYIGKIAADAQDDPGLLVDLSLVERRLGDIAGSPTAANLGDSAAAAQHYQRAVDLVRRALKLKPGDEEAQLALARALHSQGDFYFWNDDLARAQKLYQEELPLLEAHARAKPSLNSERALSAARLGIADVYFWSSRLEPALKGYRQACEPLFKLRSPSFDFQDAIAICHTRIADALAWLERYPEAEAEIDKAIAIYRPFHAAEPGNLTMVHAMSVVLTKRGEILAWSGKSAQSFAAYSELVGIAQAAHRADPSDVRAARDAGLAFNKRGDAYAEAKRFPEAIADYQNARTIIQRLSREDPGQREYERDFALSSHRLGIALFDSGDRAGSVRYFDEELRIMRRRWREAPDKAWSRRDLAVALQDRMEAPAADPAQVCAWRVEFRDLMQSLVDMGATNPGDAQELERAKFAVRACAPAG
jgi:non-specific serine/threonine protein kinase/serine/threonine-protein kinase